MNAWIWILIFGIMSDVENEADQLHEEKLQS